MPTDKLAQHEEYLKKQHKNRFEMKLTKTVKYYR